MALYNKKRIRVREPRPISLDQRRALERVSRAEVRFWEGTEKSFTFNILQATGNSLLRRGLAKCLFHPGERNGILELTDKGREELKKK